MNTRTAPQVFSFVSALLVTLVMLAGVNTLATSEPAPHLAVQAVPGQIQA
jgi:hypothetical protein